MGGWRWKKWVLEDERNGRLNLEEKVVGRWNKWRDGRWDDKGVNNGRNQWIEDGRNGWIKTGRNGWMVNGEKFYEV